MHDGLHELAGPTLGSSRIDHHRDPTHAIGTLCLIWVNGRLLSKFMIDVLFPQEKNSYSSPLWEE
jgi:hypothetical protein